MIGGFFMAQKGQKFNKYTPEFKLKVVSDFKKGFSYSWLSKKYNVPEGTIATWIHQINAGNIDILTNCKKRKNLSEQNYKEKYEILKKYHTFLKAQRKKK